MGLLPTLLTGGFGLLDFFRTNALQQQREGRRSEALDFLDSNFFNDFGGLQGHRGINFGGESLVAPIGPQPLVGPSVTGTAQRFQAPLDLQALSQGIISDQRSGLLNTIGLGSNASSDEIFNRVFGFGQGEADRLNNRRSELQGLRTTQEGQASSEFGIGGTFDRGFQDTFNNLSDTARSDTQAGIGQLGDITRRSVGELNQNRLDLGAGIDLLGLADPEAVFRQTLGSEQQAVLDQESQSVLGLGGQAFGNLQRAGVDPFESGAFDLARDTGRNQRLSGLTDARIAAGQARNLTTSNNATERGLQIGRNQQVNSGLDAAIGRLFDQELSGVGTLLDTQNRNIGTFGSNLQNSQAGLASVLQGRLGDIGRDVGGRIGNLDSDINAFGAGRQDSALSFLTGLDSEANRLSESDIQRMFEGAFAGVDSVNANNQLLAQMIGLRNGVLTGNDDVLALLGPLAGNLLDAATPGEVGFDSTIFQGGNGTVQ